MELFGPAVEKLFDEMAGCGKMVLSTSLDQKVTSRMMSVIRLDDQFYFQTDLNFRKYSQLQQNPFAALCMDNFQIEGRCIELGHPSQNKKFCELFAQYFKNAYDRYTHLKDERLFALKPTYIQKWIYENGEPFIEIFDFEHKNYLKKAYNGQ